MSQQQAREAIQNPPEGLSLTHQAEALAGELRRFNQKSSTAKAQDAGAMVALAVAVIDRQARQIDALTDVLEELTGQRPGR